MSLLLLLALVWLGLRSLAVLSQMARHSPEAQLARTFENELRQRGLRGDAGGQELDR